MMICGTCTRGTAERLRRRESEPAVGGQGDVSTQDRIRWDERYRARGREVRPPSPFLTALDPLLPRGADPAGRPPTALDVAGGTGRHALWLARRGLDVTLADVSPVALEIARVEAAVAAVHLRFIELDLEEQPFPPGPFDVIVSFDFLHRPLFDAFPESLAPGGLLVFSQPTRTNLERHTTPGPTHLLEDGEIPRLVKGLAVLRCEQGWFGGRHEARLVARKPRR